MFRNPFEEQSHFHKREAKKWITASKVIGVILIIMIYFLFGTC